ncbi:MAG: hypothetical protein QG558_1791, partial [Campylobacterota bacterium]|nr:hypothetical protein [Campylobacterota bacterium]
GVTVTDTLPAGMLFNGTSSAGWSCSGVGSPVVVTCTKAILDKSSSSSLVLNVTAPTSSTSGTVTFTNTATVTTSSPTDNVLGNNTSNVVTVTLNRPPVTVNDLVNTASHTAVSGNVLTNDSDLDGDSLSVTNAGTFTLSFGSITIAANGAFTYTPGYFTGETDEYTYTVSDGRGGVTTGTLQIGIGSACTATGLVNAERNFCLRKQTVLFGDMVTVGNTLVVPPDPQPASATQTTYCSTYTNGAFLTDTPSLDNQSLYLCSYKPDSNLNATTAELNIPVGSTIKWAGLYLQSVVKHSDASALLSMSVKIKKDNGSYVNVGTPNVVNYGSYTTANSTNYDNYSAFIDVTSQFTANSWKDGSYTIANVPVTTDTIKGSASVIGKYGAWSLVVIYENVSKPLKSVSIYDGWQKITGNGASTSATITVDNFYTPTSGSIDSAVSIFAAEGDKYRTGDNFQGYKNSTSSWVSLGTADNAFDSSIVSSGTRVPSLNNNQGIDIETYQIGTAGKNLLSNSQSSISFKLWTGGEIDYFYPSMLAFSTEVYHPRMCYYEKLYDSNGDLLTTGSLVAKGSAIDVKVLLKNDMNEPAEKVMLYRTFDTTLPYTPSSTGYKLNPTGVTIADKMANVTTSVTDALDGDIFDYSTPLKLFSLHAGTGATFNQGGDFTFGQEAIFNYGTTANFDGNTSISYQIAYTMPTIGFRYEGELVKCEEFDNTFGVLPSVIITDSAFDARETSIAEAEDDRVITSKIANQPFQLNVVSLDSSGNISPYTLPLGNRVYLFPVNTDFCTQTYANQLTDLYTLSHDTYVDFEQGDTTVSSPAVNLANALTSSDASTDKRIAFNYINWSDYAPDLSALHCSVSNTGGSTLQGVPQCLEAAGGMCSKYGRVTSNIECLFGPAVALACAGANSLGESNAGDAPCNGSSYAGSRLPDAPFDNEYGCYQCISQHIGEIGCTTDNFAVRPDTYTAVFTGPAPLIAGQEFDITTVAKGVGGTALTGYNGIAAVTPQTQIDICAVPDGNLTNSLDAPIGAIFFDGVDTNISNNIKFGDVGVFDLNITDSTWTAVDSTKNPKECIENDDTNILDADMRVGCLTRFTATPTVIPDHFDVNGTLTNGSAGGFTYLNNFENNASLDQNISATLNAVVTAKAFNINTTTQNYSSECYAKSGNSVLNITLNPSPPDLTQLLWYDDNNNSVVGSFAIAGPFSFPHPPARFTSGVGNLIYRLNFDRNQTMVVNPFTMTVNEVNATDSDSVDGNQTLTSNNSAYYVYGRIIPRDVRVFGANTPFTANAWYEVYKASALNGTSLPVSKNDANWYTNTLHTDLSDGDGDVTRMQTNGAAAATSPLFDTNTFMAGVETYSETTGWLLNGYKAHIDTAPWLWYGINALNYVDPATGDTEGACLTHPCFNINIAPAVGATGSAKSTNEATKASKKSDSSGWRSTTDYAPAVR